MEKFKNALEIFKLLEKSNCKKCGKPTCMAFAADVFIGQKNIGDCPLIPEEVLQKYGSFEKSPEPFENEFAELLDQLKSDISAIDLAYRAQDTGGSFDGDCLTLKIMGKDFSVRVNGDIKTDLHVNPWIVGPVFYYILHATDKTISGKWITMREIKEGVERYALFKQRFERSLKRIADSYPDFFEDLIRIFNGRHVEKHDKSDISLVLLPLPKVPVLFCYWKPEDGLESDLKIYFDSTVEEHISSEVIYAVAAGLSGMFEKIASNHGAIPGV